MITSIRSNALSSSVVDFGRYLMQFHTKSNNRLAAVVSSATAGRVSIGKAIIKTQLS